MNPSLRTITSVIARRRKAPDPSLRSGQTPQSHSVTASKNGDGGSAPSPSPFWSSLRATILSLRVGAQPRRGNLLSWRTIRNTLLLIAMASPIPGCDIPSFCAGAPGDGPITTAINVVLGQIGLSQNNINRTGDPNSVGQNTLYNPWDIVLDTSTTTCISDNSTAQHIYVADTKNNRILRWCSLSPPTGALAELVLGQEDFRKNFPNRGELPAQDTLNQPKGVSVITIGNDTYIAVADTENNRVLMWIVDPDDTIDPSIENGEDADIVLGQDRDNDENYFNNNAANNGENKPSAHSLKQPTDVFLQSYIEGGGTKLRIFVADAGNNRVVVWENLTNRTADSAAPTVRYYPINPFNPTNPPDATYVIGQKDSEDSDDPTNDPCDEDEINLGNEDQDNNNNPDQSRDSLYGPTSIYLNGTDLFINDQKNNRILTFTVSSPPAGQCTPSNGENCPALSLKCCGTSTTSDCTTNPGKVSDAKSFTSGGLGNPFDSGPTSNPANNAPNANFCVGQRNLTEGITNQINGQSGSPRNNNLNNPFDMFSDGLNLWVSDTGNNRILRFGIPTISFTNTTSDRRSCNGNTSPDSVAPQAETNNVYGYTGQNGLIGQISFMNGGFGTYPPIQFNSPNGIFIDNTSTGCTTTACVWIADTLNNRAIRVQNP